MSLQGEKAGEAIQSGTFWFAFGRRTMTFLVSLSFLLLAVFFGPAVFSAETSLVETLPTSFSAERSSPGHFEITITRNGRTVPRPGPVFTERAEEGLSLPYLLSVPKAISYPHWAVRRGWEGRVVIAVEILPTGKVGRWKVMESTGYSLLDEAALRAVRQWRFHPAIQQGKAVVSCIQIPIHFKLQD